VVNAEQFEAFIVSPAAAESVADGVPSAELFLLALLNAKSLPEGSRLLRVRVGPGGAIPLTALRARVPARLQHLAGIRDGYLLPAARLGRVFALDTFRVDRHGHLLRDGECAGGSLRIRCSYPARSIAGLPNEVRRWPATRNRRAYALLPAGCARLPGGWLRLYRRRPPVRSGRLMLELQVPRERTIDVALTAEALARFTRVRTQAERLRAARVELILGSRSYGRVTVRRAYRADGSGWRRVPRVESGPLPDFLARLQASPPT
jgi:hypothetical protein